MLNSLEKKKKDPGRPLFQSEQNHMFELEKLCWVFQILGANTLVVWRFWGQKSTVSFRGLKSRCELGWFPLEALRKTPFPYLLKLLEAACVSWFVGPSSTFKQHPFNLFFHHHIAFSSLTPPSLANKDHYDYIWAHPENSWYPPPRASTSSHLESPFYHLRHYLQFSGIKIWLGAFIQSATGRINYL